MKEAREFRDRLVREMMKRSGSVLRNRLTTVGQRAGNEALLTRILRGNVRRVKD